MSIRRFDQPVSDVTKREGNSWCVKVSQISMVLRSHMSLVTIMSREKGECCYFKHTMTLKQKMAVA